MARNLYVLMNDIVNHTKLTLVKMLFQKYLNDMSEESRNCSKVIGTKINKPLVMTKKDHECFKNSTKCWICKKASEEGKVKVKDHDHITGIY